MRSKPANRRAALAVIILGAYLQLVEWVNLFPWNDVRNGNGQETLDLILAGATIVLALWLWFGGRLAAAVASLALGAWAYLQAATWWSPYFNGASSGWKRVWERWFSDTIHVLPITQDKLPPDANHLVLQLLIVAALIMSVWALFSAKRSS